jgi:predicted class III extradiol MEMO1 family dioxygenase
MKWKRYYRDEFNLLTAQDTINELFSASSQNHLLDAMIRNGAVCSFPHTSLLYAGEAQAQVISSLYRTGRKRVIALGVFHVWGHESTKAIYQQAMNDKAPSDLRECAFSRLNGAFLPGESHYDSPYGKFPFAPLPPEESARFHRDTEALLAQEFSLDTFFTLVKYYSLVHDMPPLKVVPIYIGMTRDPLQGSFGSAAEIGEALRLMISPEDAIVATGDVVHYGMGYSDKETMHVMPLSADELQLRLREDLQQTLDLVMRRKEYERAFPKLDRFLNNDQRYLLPVLSEYLGGRADYEIMSFQLSDYAAINEVRNPCVVASSLIAYLQRPARSGCSQRREEETCSLENRK